MNNICYKIYTHVKNMKKREEGKKKEELHDMSFFVKKRRKYQKLSEVQFDNTHCILYSKYKLVPNSENSHMFKQIYKII